MTSLLFRSSTNNDLDAIYQLALQSGVGITTFPKRIDLLTKKISLSVDSFDQSVHSPGQEYYLFVVEDPETHTVVGTSAIKASVGYDAPFYTYKLTKRTHVCRELGIQSDVPILTLVNDLQGKSALCTLYLKPEYRHSHNGEFLSRSRFLYMANYPERFESSVIAEMRGVTDSVGNTPFWDNVGKHFFQMTFSEADELSLSSNKQFIADLLPEYPIYIQLLTPDVQAIIGKPHHDTVPAMRILFNEGFSYLNYVDIFDAGPTIEAQRDEIITVKNRQLAPITRISDSLTSSSYILTNTEGSFRATIGQVFPENKGVAINHESAELLQVKLGSVIRYVPFKGNLP